jgi:two-component system OmpR family sensor kinase
MSRLPIRLKLTLAFAAAMAVLLTALGLFIFLSFRSQLDDAVTSGLESQVQDLKAVLANADEEGAGQIKNLLGGDDTFAEVLATSGRPRYTPAQLEGDTVLDHRQLVRASRGRVLVDEPGVPGLPGRVRILAVPAEARGGRIVVVVVGATLEDRDAAIANLRRLMLIGGPIALLIASLVGYAVSSAALRPVDRMRRRAATISAAEPSERLPVPESRDEISRLGETLNAMLARLEAAIERERRFVDDASHELRTPLAMHRAELELALRYGGKSPQELRGAIASAIEEVDRLIQLAEALLVVARSQDGKVPLKRESIEVVGLFDGIRQRFEGRAEESGRTLRVSSPAELRVDGDRLRLEQALTNVVDNALRYGGGQISLDAARRNGIVELHVVDAGPGFPAPFLEHAFERFSRADAARSGPGGTGLGLAIVDAIARAHEGQARVANLPGGGADVWIELPG